MKLVTRLFAIFAIATFVLAAGCTGDGGGETPANGGGETPAAGENGGDEGEDDGGETETGSTEGSVSNTTQVSYTVEGMN